MKNKKWVYPLLIILCLAVFAGYKLIVSAATDTKAPVISALGDIQVEVAADYSAFLTGVSASDNRDGDVTGSIVVEKVELLDSDGTISVTYAAFDSAGNVAKTERTGMYTDYESPRFTLSAPLAFSSSNFDVLKIVGATDKIDGNIQHRVRATLMDDASITSMGVHDVQFRVTNSLGDAVEIILPVEVYSGSGYNAKLTLTDYLIYLPVGADFDEDDYLNAMVCYGEEVALSGENRNKYSVHTNGYVDTDTPGVYTISYEVVYNQIYIGYSKLIVVVEG
ncbi:MAG: hypothetical protein IJ017_00695 [Oscillospiraceae bacterium]|nr:hypothetical protein [Oscillospiraceae bacterium]